MPRVEWGAKARYETLGTHSKSILSSEGAALSARTSEFIRSVVPPLKGLNKCVPIINPGLAPWAMQEYRPCRAHWRFHHQSITLLFWCGCPGTVSLYQHNKSKTYVSYFQNLSEVCTDYSWSLQKVLRTYKFKYAYLPKCLRVLIIVSTRTYWNEYDVLTKAFTRKYW